MAKEEWTKIEGQWHESCVAPPVCPAYFLSEFPKAYCQGAMTFHITKGEYKGSDLAGLTVVGGFHVPGRVFHETLGKVVVVIYIDDRATKAQFEGLKTIWTEAWSKNWGPVKTVKRVPITFKRELVGAGPGFKYLIDIPDILHIESESLLGPNGQPTRIENSPLFGGTIYLGKAKINEYRDPDGACKWYECDRSATYFDFEISPGQVWHPKA